MNRAKQNPLVAILTIFFFTTGALAQVQTTIAPARAKALIPDAKPIRTCGSLVRVSLPNTTIESAAVDPKNPGVCRVTAVTTHPPSGDKVRIWVGIPTSNWNGRFMGAGGGGFSGGSANSIMEPVAQGFSAAA